MGVVKIDIHKKEEQFSEKEYGFGCKKDIYHLLFHIGFIYCEGQKGNYEALCLFEDFCKYAQNYPLLSTYVKMDCGLQESNCKLTLFQNVAEYHDIPEDECKYLTDCEMVDNSSYKLEIHIL